MVIDVGDINVGDICNRFGHQHVQIVINLNLAHDIP